MRPAAPRKGQDSTFDGGKDGDRHSLYSFLPTPGARSSIRKEPTRGSALPISMVAGTGFEPVTFGL
jgi:hypothetical protein